MEEIYAIPLFPALAVRDLEVSLEFYREALGFKCIFAMPGPDGKPALVHLRWDKYADLLLTLLEEESRNPEPKGAGVSIHFSLQSRFEGDIRAFAARARDKGATVNDPVTRPWNTLEVSILDPDGYRLVFNAPVNPNP